MKKLRIKSLENRSSLGSALIAVLAMLAIMFILFTVNSKTLLRLSREVDVVNKHQTNHWATLSTPTPTSAAKQ